MVQQEENEKLVGNLSSSDSSVDVALPHPKESWFKQLSNYYNRTLSFIWNNGYASMGTAAVVFSISALFVKMIHGKLTVFEIVVFRSSLSFIFCVFIARFHKVEHFFGTKECFLLLLGRGLFGAAAMTFYYMTIELMPLGDAVTLFFLNPAVTAVAAWLILREPLGIRGFAGVMMSFIGLVLVTRPPFLFPTSSSSSSSSSTATNSTTSLYPPPSDSSYSSSATTTFDTVTTTSSTTSTASHDQIMGSFFGLIAAFCAAAAFITIRKIGKREPPLVMSVYFHMTSFMTSIIPLIMGYPTHFILPSGTQAFYLLLIAVTSLMGQMLLGRGFQLLSAAKASAINFTQVIYSYVLGIFFLSEHLSLLGALGSSFVAGGVVLVNMKPKKKEAPPLAVALVATSGSSNGATIKGGSDDGCAKGGDSNSGKDGDRNDKKGKNIIKEQQTEGQSDIEKAVKVLRPEDEDSIHNAGNDDNNATELSRLIDGPSRHAAGHVGRIGEREGGGDVIIEEEEEARELVDAEEGHGRQREESAVVARGAMASEAAKQGSGDSVGSLTIGGGGDGKKEEESKNLVSESKKIVSEPNHSWSTHQGAVWSSSSSSSNVFGGTSSPLPLANSANPLFSSAPAFSISAFMPMKAASGAATLPQSSGFSPTGLMRAKSGDERVERGGEGRDEERV